MENEWTKEIEKLEKENIELKETIKDLRGEGEEYDKRLNKIDFLAMQVEIRIKEIRSKI